MIKSINSSVDVYSQSSSCRTYFACKQLRIANGGLKFIIEDMGRMLPKKSIDCCISAKPKVKDLRDLYTHENIEKETAISWDENKFIKRSVLADSNSLYQFALSAVNVYFATHPCLSDRDNFCLSVFLGGLFSHLPGMDVAASECYKKALHFADSLHEVDLSSIINDIKNKRLIKHQAICPFSRLAKNKNALSIEDTLLSKVYFESKLHSSFPSDFLDESLKIFSDLFKGIQSTKFSKLILKLNALDSLHHNRFKILFVLPIENNNTVGTYNFRNTVRVCFRTPEKTRRTLFHELTHKAMDQVFENMGSPYFQNDKKAKYAYRESMRQVLLNLLNLAGTIAHIDKDKLDLNELVTLCFSEKSATSLIRDTNIPFVGDLFNKLQTLFSDSYPVSRLDPEFITHTLQYLLDVQDDSVYIHCIQPLLDYIDLYVIPEMEAYINMHPCKDRIIP